ncbi:hypothetical protein CAFE_18710 [Caprobacter fermentans]|uniref:Uncharacterized protein n=1 Tax=Caproicibacter fermentans TaxID=2576756 RepID=A0A6N8HZ84_9FIRM|nr:hypothetical protein [Caproicibacter fermentans]MVB11164.1 hypothetical protein [Caproicibacter fermentans]
MIYECIKSFELDKYDDNGFSTDEIMEIEKGSLWELNDDGGNIIGAEHHLDNLGGSSWVEIDSDYLRKYFKEANHAG